MLISKQVPWSLKDVQPGDDGRSLIVKEMMTFANIYCSNVHQDCYLKPDLADLQMFAQGIVVLVGDLNCSLDSVTDNYAKCPAIQRRVLNRISKLLHDFQLLDVWRTQHPQEKYFTF